MPNFVNRRSFLGALSAFAGGLPLLSGWRSALATPKKVSQEPPREVELWYREPADRWTDALPLGNGRLGAMVFGGVASERIALNEDTLWSGSPRDWNNPGAKEHLPVVRDRVIGKQDYHGADQECRKMQGPFNQAYEPLGDLVIALDHGDDATGYRRSLDLDSALSTVEYTIGPNRYRRETLVSAPEQLIAVRLSIVGPGTLNGTIHLQSQLQAKAEALGSGITLSGKAPSNSVPQYLRDEHAITYSADAGKGMHFAARLTASVTGGTVEALPDGGLKLARAREAVLLVGAATGYRGFDRMPDTPVAGVVSAANRPLTAAASLGFERIKQRHVEDHRALFRRVSLDLTGNEPGANEAGAKETAARPTDERLDGFEQQPDMGLLALYFHYGRYLLIASSRPGCQPANLQGIWNADVRPPWSSNWTSNINVQMNYWLAETCNLHECHQPLVEMVGDLSVNGAKTAKINYGAEGWCSHHNIDLWRQSAPVGEGLQFADPTWANFAMSGPWLCQHLWAHYEFSGNREYLRATAYPVMKGSAEFCLSWLTDDGKGGLTTCPSVSTENTFVAPDGKSAQVSAGCTMDIALLHELFGNCQAAAKALGTDAEFASHLASIEERLPKYQVGKYGQLQEWAVDFDEDQPGQRHMSHLYPVYPGGEITRRSSPALAVAARKSLERRLANGGAYTGWSRAWAIGLWARLADGDKALESLQMLMVHSTGINLFDQHPSGESLTDAMQKSRGPAGSSPARKVRPSTIFQIDGNFGATGAIAEMLLHSHDGEIAILPAWPAAWRTGSVRGLRARGGVEVDIAWDKAKSVGVTVRALSAGEHRLRAPAGFRFAAEGGHAGGETTMLRVEEGKRYRLSAVAGQ